mmetsp:Transcript_15663/g.30280  ORF Transcript_15663/g.30280 Transcript_15663/m.30280 type:complete len:454 (-) Transcript_15663:163-1524(-)|eukprot:CAMPEP_0171497972 /NCGR_PEP_ID=MMETSP0958-20121227/7580_1 /TAXON_ID=87120 /ORGANISM="Aurantiochytrium limacinum, Strain ATCCMYA-1381" /LENGTH=453 /DNA_ID=CAMNT_0012032297 /DNA_START=64 /DNA_END=1425 /DNA_ORIENTATION=-
MADDEADKNVELWKMKKLIKTLTMAKGNGTSMISLIMPPGEQLPKVNKMLTDEAGTATNIKSRVNRLSVLSAITSTQQRLKLYNKCPPNGLVLFVGTILTDEGKEKKVSIDFEPFKPINTSLYMCDNRFHTEALEELLTDDDKFGFVVMDGNGCLFGTLSGNTREVITKFTVDLPKKHGRGGQSALRFARLRLEKRHNYVRKCAETAVTCFITNDRPNVKGIVLAGSAEFKNVLAGSDLFDPRLKAVVIQLVDVSYGGENGFNQAIELAQDALANVKFVKEKKLITNFFDEIAQDTGKICFGIQETFMALEMGAVETLLVWENLEHERFELLNNQTGEITFKTLSPEQAQDSRNFVTADGVDLEIKERMALTEYLATNYRNFGTTLEFITDKSQQGSQFCKGFGGIGGILRWPVQFSALDPNNAIVDDAFAEEENDDDELDDPNSIDWDDIGF